MTQNEIIILLNLKSAQALQQLSGFLLAAGSKLAGFAAGAISIHEALHLEEMIEGFSILGEKIGQTAKTASGLTYVTDRLSLSQETLTRGMKTLSVEMSKNGEADKSVVEKMLELADRFEHTEGGARRAAIAVQYFGKAGVDMIPVLAQGSDALREMIARGEELYGIDSKAEEQSKDFKRALVDLKTALAGVGVTIIKDVGPSLVWLLERFSDLVASLRAVTNAWAELWQKLGSASAGQGFKVPESPDKAKPKEGSDGDFLTQDKFEDRKAQLEIDIKRNQMNESLAKSDYTQSAEVRLRAMNRAIENQIKLLGELRDLYGEAGGAGLVAPMEVKKQEQDILAKRNALRTEVQPESIGGAKGTVNVGIEKQIQAWGTAAEQVATIFTSSFSNAISSISSGITGLVMGTKTWGQAVTQVYTQIATQFVNMISEMVLKWVFQHTVMALVGEAFRTGETASTAVHTGTQVAIHAGGETAKTGATATGVFSRGALRFFETIFHGVQVAIKVGAHIAGEILMTAVSIVQSAIRVGVIIAEAIKWLFQAAFKGASAVADIPYVGPFLAIAAIGAIIAAGVGAMGGFQGGGYTGDGAPSEPAGMAHKGEYYFTAAQTRRIGVADLDRIAKGLPVERPEMFVSAPRNVSLSDGPRSSGAPSGDASSQSPTLNIAVHNWNDEAAMRKHIAEDPQTHHVLLDKMRREGHVIGARS